MSKRDGKLIGHAKDPISSGLAWWAFVPPGHWQQTEGQVLCLGAGGAATAIGVYLAKLAEERPKKIITTDIREDRLEHLRDVHAKLEADILFDYVLSESPEQNNALMAALPRGSMVINATGMGKDRPGSPITDQALFPENGLVWELNYRGELDFLQQARRQAEARKLKIEDGWIYFLHGWTQIIAEVFDVRLTPEVFRRLEEAAL